MFAPTDAQSVHVTLSDDEARVVIDYIGVYASSCGGEIEYAKSSSEIEDAARRVAVLSRMWKEAEANSLLVDADVAEQLRAFYADAILTARNARDSRSSYLAGNEGSGWDYLTREQNLAAFEEDITEHLKIAVTLDTIADRAGHALVAESTVAA